MNTDVSFNSELNPSIFPRRPYLAIAIIVGIIFLLGANKAWWYHREHADPDKQYFVYRVQNTIKLPILWQYDLDAQEEFEAAQFFPERYRYRATLISRPLLQFSVNTIARVLQIVFNPILLSDVFKGWLENHSLISPNAPNLEKILFTLYVMLGFVIFKLSLFFVSGIMMFRLLENYSNSDIATLGVSLLFFGGYSIKAISTFHTYEFAFITPIIILYLFWRLSESYTLPKNIIFSLVVGTLMLGRPNYAVYLSVLVYALFVCKFDRKILLAVSLSCFVHLLPWVSWQLFLEFKDMAVIGIFGKTVGSPLALHPGEMIGRKIFNRELVTQINQIGAASQVGVDFIETIPGVGPIQFAQLAIRHFTHSISQLPPVWLVIGVYGLSIFKSSSRQTLLFLVFIVFICTWLQAFVALPFGPKSRTVFDPAIFIFGFSAYALYQTTTSCGLATRRGLLSAFLICHLLLTPLLQLKLPYIHPSTQIGGIAE